MSGSSVQVVDVCMPMHEYYYLIFTRSQDKNRKKTLERLLGVLDAVLDVLARMC